MISKDFKKQLRAEGVKLTANKKIYQTYQKLLKFNKMLDTKGYRNLHRDLSVDLSSKKIGMIYESFQLSDVSLQEAYNNQRLKKSKKVTTAKDLQEMKQRLFTNALNQVTEQGLSLLKEKGFLMKHSVVRDKKGKMIIDPETGAPSMKTRTLKNPSLKINIMTKLLLDASEMDLEPTMNAVISPDLELVDEESEELNMSLVKNIIIKGLHKKAMKDSRIFRGLSKLSDAELDMLIDKRIETGKVKFLRNQTNNWISSAIEAIEVDLIDLYLGVL